MMKKVCRIQLSPPKVNKDIMKYEDIQVPYLLVDERTNCCNPPPISIKEQKAACKYVIFEK